MNFNFTSQICTTEEQSKRLLALGLRKETADMAHIAFGGGGMMIRPYEWLPTTGVDMENFIPAWSLHRLMTLLMIGDKLGCITHNIHQNNISTYYELVIASIEHLIKIDEFNKEYLEE